MKKSDVPLKVALKPKKRTDLSDPLEALSLIKDAIISRDVDPDAAKEAIRGVLKQYELRNRVFLVGEAQAELPRIIRLLRFLEQCEEEMFRPARVEEASLKELTRLYAVAQSNLVSSLDTVKKVADMRLEMLAAGGRNAQEQFMDPEADEIKAMAGMPGLDAPSRDRVRKLVSGLVDALDKDNSVEEFDEYTDDDTED